MILIDAGGRGVTIPLGASQGQGKVSVAEVRQAARGPRLRRMDGMDGWDGIRFNVTGRMGDGELVVLVLLAGAVSLCPRRGTQYC